MSEITRLLLNAYISFLLILSIRSIDFVRVVVKRNASLF